VKNGSRAVPAAPARAEPRAGQIIGERYRLEELLERGAMGSVWRAEQLSLRAPVAIKFIEPSWVGDPEMNERFLREARSAATIRSVHVVQIFDYGSDDNVPFIAMEYLAGENLDARLSRQGTLTPAELEKIFSEVARGIGQAHSLGVIHRDLKPGNIFLAREGEHEVTKVIDFGIAKVMVEALEHSRHGATRLGSLLGTPQYMSPEQIRGSSLLDYRTDLWALAIIACECLTGRHPFSGATIGDLTVQICTERPLAPSSLGNVPAGFDRWFFKGTSKQSSLRFDSAEKMASALRKILLAAGGRRRQAWSRRLAFTGQRIGGRVSMLSTFVAVLHHRTIALVSAPLRRAWRPRLTRSGLAFLALGTCGLGVFWLLQAGVLRRAAPTQGSPPKQGASAAPWPTMVLPMTPGRVAPDKAPVHSLAADGGAPDGVSVGGADVSDTIVSDPSVGGAGPQPALVRAVARPRKPASRPTEVTPLGPMSIAMGRAGASILEGEGMRREARARAAAAAQTSAREKGVPSPPVSPPAPRKPE
jgi:hypothetical protein